MFSDPPDTLYAGASSCWIWFQRHVSSVAPSNVSPALSPGHETESPVEVVNESNDAVTGVGEPEPTA